VTLGVRTEAIRSFEHEEPPRRSLERGQPQLHQRSLERGRPRSSSGSPAPPCAEARRRPAPPVGEAAPRSPPMEPGREIPPPPTPHELCPATPAGGGGGWGWRRSLSWRMGLAPRSPAGSDPGAPVWVTDFTAVDRGMRVCFPRCG
jgi:hypothetical protein